MTVLESPDIETPMDLVLEGPDGSLSATVVKVAGGRLTARASATDSERIVRCTRGLLHGPDGTIPISDLTIGVGSDGTLTLESGDLESKGRIWALGDRLRAVAVPTQTASEHPGPVPGRGHYSEEARRQRLDWLRASSGSPLADLDRSSLDARQLAGNIENFVGAVELPVGLAGPMLFGGERVRGYVTAPLATTEGTLVASTSRGAAAVSRSGGMQTHVVSQRMVRAPVYAFDDLHSGTRFVRWVGDHLEDLRREVATVSRHARLVEIEPLQVGNLVYLRFLYETGDAAGQNMTTAGTWQAAQWINRAVECVPELRVRYFAIEGNASGDKKASFVNYLGGRGTRVTAECFLSREAVRDVLKTTPEALEYGHHLGVAGGVQIGMVGHSINAANVIAAMFTATGQDIGCVHESGSAISFVEATRTGIYASMVLPSLVVGTVGGGTALPAQQQFLEVLGCRDEGGAGRLAEIVCGFALALDISTGAAVVGGQFADAHERLGRNRPVNGLQLHDLISTAQPLLARSFAAPDLRILEADALECDASASIIAEALSREANDKLVGLYLLRCEYRAADGGVRIAEAVAKVKALDEEAILAGNKAASLCGGDLAHEYSRWREWTGAKGSHTRELAIYRQADPRLRAVLPRVHGVHEDPRREAYAVVMERLDEAGTILKDSTDRPDAWASDQIDAALKGIAGVHSIWLDREQELLAENWLGPFLTAARMAEMRPLWRALVEHNSRQFPHWIDVEARSRLELSIEGLDRWWAAIEELPRTLVHNDFNPRNVALRARDETLVAYDWELATLHLPQRDLAEFLAFVLPPDVEEATVEGHLEVHRAALEAAAERELGEEEWRHGYRLALRDFELTRLQLYMMGNVQREFSFLDRLVATTQRLARIEVAAELRPAVAEPLEGGAQ